MIYGVLCTSASIFFLRRLRWTTRLEAISDLSRPSRCSSPSSRGRRRRRGLLLLPFCCVHLLLFSGKYFLCYDFGDFGDLRKFKLASESCRKHEKNTSETGRSLRRSKRIALFIKYISTTMSSQKSVTSPDRSGSQRGVLTEERLRVINLELCVWRFVLMHFLEGAREI